MTRLSCNINDETAKIMRDRPGITATEHVRRAFGVYEWVLNTMKDGGEIIARDKHGDMRTLVFLP